MPGLSLHHISINVGDLADAATEVAAAVGAGPFFQLPDTRWDRIEAGDGDVEAQWDHSIAFGYAGETLIELSVNRALAPTELERALTGHQVSHLGFSTEDFPGACEQLIRSGARRILTAENAAMSISYFVHPLLGTVEIVSESERSRRMLGVFREAAQGWDGRDPLRRFP
ncbi:VOC family protein [Sphaerisporangium sp. NPDC051011]|uniref:VOC family protein n=1 Tax=Sphaerisporangium sp. NPDC051011 TaxID=3155792 RepID=UPI0033C83864